MKLFRHRNRQATTDTRTLWARYELVYTAVDIAAALSFVLGSLLFFSPEMETAATVGWLVGSILFAAKPSIRMVREIHLYRIGHLDHLAHRAEP